MKHTVFRPISYLLGMGALTIASSSLSAHAEMPSGNKSVELLSAAAPTSFVEQLTSGQTLTQTPQDTVDAQLPSNVVNSAQVKPAQPKYDPLFGLTTAQSNPLFGLTTAQSNPPSSNETRYEEINPNPSYIAHIDKSKADTQIGQSKEINPNPSYIAHIDMSQADTQIGQLKEISKYPAHTSDKVNIAMASANPGIASPNPGIAQNAVAAIIATPPIPGTLATSAQLLLAPQTQPPVQQAFRLGGIFSNKPETTLAQADLDRRRGTVGVPNYIGIGGNLGLSDNKNNTSLGDGGFVVNSKISLTSKLSLRPAAIFGNDTTFLIPLTYDFVIPTVDPFEPIHFAPFLGGGLAISTDSGNNIGFLFTGGVDVPISRAFVANASINLGFIEDETDFGLMIGVGYTFPKR